METPRTDLTSFSKNELKLIIHNTEHLYNEFQTENAFSGNCNNLINDLKQWYIFTDEQQEILENSF